MALAEKKFVYAERNSSIRVFAYNRCMTAL